MDYILYLPNRRGNYEKTQMPKYIRGILTRRLRHEDIPRLVCVGPYRYYMRGYNKQRPGYGLRSDMAALTKWAKRYFTVIEDVEYHERPKDYYVEFTMYDPLAQQLEKANLIR